LKNIFVIVGFLLSSLLYYIHPAAQRKRYLGNKMKQTYIVEFSTTNTQDGWSRIEFTSITKALGFVSLMVKQGTHCQIFKG